MTGLRLPSSFGAPSQRRAVRQVGPLDLPVVIQQPGVAVGDPITLPLPGTWTFTATARYGEFDEVAFVATLTVS